jgi:CelD/BcsL family acetyltransferase involved in cellulose biosynthesis
MPVEETARTQSGDRMTAEREVIQLTDIGQLGPRIDEWRDLAARIEGSSYFQTPDWVLNCWQDAGRPPAEIAFWRNTSGQLEAVACLTEARERLVRKLPITLRITTNLGSGRPHSADHCGWPVMPHRVADVQHWVATHHWRNPIVLRHLDQDTGVPLVPRGGRLVLTTPCPRLYIDRGAEARKPSRNLRQHINRCKRKLALLGVSFTWTPPEAMTIGAIDILFALSESRRSLKGSSSFIRERSADFHRRLIGWSGEGRGCAMVLAICEGRPIGIAYGFVWRDTFYTYQGGWDAAWAHLSMGTVLESETIRLVELCGLRCVDFLRGRELYKYRFGSVDKMDESWLVPRGFSGWLIGRKFQAVRVQRLFREVLHTDRNDREKASSATAPSS